MKNTRLYLWIVLLIPVGLNAQKILISNPIEAKFQMSFTSVFDCDIHQNKFIQYHSSIARHKGEILIREGKDLNKYKTDLDINGVKASTECFSFYKNKITTFNLAQGDGNRHGVLYAQNYTYDFKKIGNPISIDTLKLPSKFSTNSSFGYYLSDATIDIDSYHSKNEQYTLVVVSIRSKKVKPYLEMILLDKNLNLIKILNKVATKKDNNLNLSNVKVFNSGNIFGILSESKIKGGGVFGNDQNIILSYNLLHVSVDGLNVKQVMPERNILEGSEISSNIVNNKILVGLKSNYKEQKDNDVAFTIYQYDITKHLLTKKANFNLTQKIIKTTENRPLVDYSITGIHLLDNGSFILALNNSRTDAENHLFDLGRIFIRLNKFGDIEWTAKYMRGAGSYSYPRKNRGKDLLYYTNKDIQVIFNVPEKSYKNEIYEPKERGEARYLGDDKDVVLKVSISLADGNVDISKLNFGSHKVNNLRFVHNLYHKTEKTGVYWILGKEDDRDAIMKIDFR